MGGYRFLTRPEEGGSLKYASLTEAFKDLSSGGGGGTITGNVTDSVPIDGDIQVTAGLSSNVSCLTYIDPITNKHIMQLSVFYI